MVSGIRFGDVFKEVLRTSSGRRLGDVSKKGRGWVSTQNCRKFLLSKNILCIANFKSKNVPLSITYSE